MSRILKIILAANLIVIAILAFAWPHLMVSPGKLIPGHTKLETDCFACHTPLLGAKSERCISCHEAEQIGRLTTAGLPIKKPLTSVPFHQKLASQDCVVCHSDHSGVKRYRQHGQFKHALLQKATLDQCQSCHKAPVDPLHEQLSGTCSQCHSQEKWTPATFDHDKYFELDRDHTTRCVTCHVRNDYRRRATFAASTSRKAFAISRIASSATATQTRMTFAEDLVKGAMTVTTIERAGLVHSAMRAAGADRIAG